MRQRSFFRLPQLPSRAKRSTPARRSRDLAGPLPEWLEARQLMAVAIAPDSYFALESNVLNVPAPGVLANDASTTGSALAVTGFSQPASGTLTLGNDGSFVYTPTPGYVGADQFTYTATDARGAVGTATVNLNVTGSTEVASVFAGTRLASVSSAQGTLLNAVLGGLIGTNLNVGAVGYTGLANGSINGGRLADALAAELGVTPAQALTTNATLAQVFTAAATAATNGGDTANAATLNALAASVGGLTAPIRLGDLIQVDPNNGSLAAASLNALDLVSGTTQLFNSRNVATTPTPVTISGAALGLPNVVPSVALSAQVVEPPILTTGPTTTQFHSAAVRIKLDLTLAQGLNTSALTAALGSLGTVTTNASLSQLSVYTEVAEGQGVISAIDAIANSVTLQATPGVASVYLGDIANNVFFDRAHVLTAADVTPGTVGNLAIRVTTPVVGNVLADVTTGIQLRAVALGTAPAAATEVFNAPFPQSRTVGTGAAFITNLVNTLTSSLDVTLSGSLGTLLNPLVNGTILPVLKPIVTGAVTPLLTPVLSGVVDPALQALGTRLGQLDLTVNALAALTVPVANADAASTPQGQAAVVRVLDNDAIPAGAIVGVSAVSTPAHGTAVINANGTVTYTPAAGYFGADAFSYTIVDTNGQASTAAVTVRVVPPAPTASADAYSTPQGAPLVVAGPGVLANDTDPNNQALTAVIATQPTRGTVVLNPDGSFTYTPASTPGNYGTDSFTYQAGNGSSLSSPVTVTVNVIPTPPTANADAYTVAAGSPLTVAAAGVLANDADANGLALTATLVAAPTHGTLVLNADGSLTYTPVAGFVGTDTFTYRAVDANASSTPATVTITVAAAPPVTNADTYAATAGSPLTVGAAAGVLANDVGPNGLPLSAVIVAAPTSGTLALNPDGSFTYTPAPGFVGSASFTYRAADSTGPGNTATVTINVGPGTPVANADAYTATAGSPLAVPAGTGVLANDTDPNGLPLSAVVATTPTHGTLALNPDGSFSYTPTAGFVGNDSFSYRATDSSGASAPVTVSITVAPGTPAATADSYNATAGGTLNVPAATGVLANDTDPNGLPLSAALAAGPAHGTLALNADGSFTYTPTLGFVGSDSFTYRATDSSGASAPVTVSITIAPGTPVANADSYTASAGTPLAVTAATGVLANDSTPNGTTLSAVVATSPAHGTLALNPDGSFTYTPTPGYVGADTFTYRATDGVLQSAAVTVSVAVLASPPVANADTYNATAGGTLSIPAASGVLANDTDPNGLPLSAAIAAGPAHGTLTLNPDGSFAYTPAAGFFGTDSFSYRATDGAAQSAPVTVTVNVAAGTPVANADSYTATAGSPLAVTATTGVLANDATPNGTTLTAVLATGPTHGTLALNSNGSFTYTPTAGYVGADSFTYRATDGASQSAPVTVTVNVGPGTPVAVADTYNATAGSPLAVTAATGVLANDSTPNGTTLTAVVATGPSHGTLALNPDGSFTYTPAAGYVGADSFTYRATDGASQSAPVTVTVNVGPGTPVAVADNYNATAGGTLSIPAASGVLANDSTPNGTTLSAVVATGPSHGTLTLNADGSFTYTPAAGFVGNDSFSYRATDSSGASAPVTVAIAVAAGTPVANADSYGATAGGTLSIPAATGVLANDSTPNGTTLTAVVATGPAHGSLTLNPDGSFSYTPAAGYVGVDTFSYRANDGRSQSGTVTVSIAVAPGTPVANADSYAATAGGTLSIPAASGVLANDATPNGTPLSAVVATGPSHGTLTLNADGSFSYTPTAGYVGADSFSYRATDGAAQSAPVTVSIAVAAAPGGGGPTAQPPQVVGTFPVTGSVGVPIVNVPIVVFTDGAGGTPPGSYTVTIDWGDGTAPSAGTVTLANGQYQVSGGHTYTRPGSFPVGVTIARPGADGVLGATLAAIAPDLSNASLSGFVFADASRDGIRQAFEVGMPGALVVLAGTSLTGQPIYRATLTAADGSYSFAGLPAGTYAIAERPANATISAQAVGQGNVGTAGGVAGIRLIGGIVLAAGANERGYDFAEAAGGSLGGTAYLDTNRNGRNDANEFGLATLVVTLTGTTAAGTPVSLTTTTDASGHYRFDGLEAGTYQVRISRPAQFFNKGRVAVGTAGGTVRGETITAIRLDGQADATGYNFGELIRAGCRLDTPALRALIRVGPAGNLPTTARPINLAANGPVVRFLPTLAALINAGPNAQQARAVKVVHVAATHHAAAPVVHAKVAVQHGKAKPKPHAHRPR